MSVQGSFLLSHTLNNNPQDSYFSYVKDYDGPPIDSKVNPLDEPVRPYIFVDKKRTRVFIDNPILTDETQSIHTDIHKILQQNPDVNGLSLILEDEASKYNANLVQLEDFLQPSRYTDIFDLHDFVKQSERSFAMLPASLRKQFNNSAAELCSALQSKDPRAVQAINDFLSLGDNNSTSQAGEQVQSTPQNIQSSEPAPSNSEQK